MLDEHHFQRGTVVCISHDHSDLSCILALAIVCSGGVVACAFPKDPYSEVLYLARKVEPKFLFCHQRNLHWADKLHADLGYKLTGIVIGDSIETIHLKPSGAADSIYHFDHLFNYDHKQSKSLHRVPVACEHPGTEIAFITMSSGTTGPPKAVPVSHRNCARDLKAFGRGPARKGIRFACSASLDYVSGRLIILGSVQSGYTTIIIGSSDPKTYLEAVQKYKIHVVYLGAASFYSLITYKHIDDYDLSSVRVAFPMGAKIIFLDELRNFLAKHPSIVQVRQGYGASEFSGGAMNTMAPDDYLKDCDNCGTLLPGMQAKILDRKTGALLGPNQEGMLLMRCHSPFLGYYDAQRCKQPLKHLDNNANIGNGEHSSPFVQDSSTFDEDGFYITGDIAYFNDKEELYIVGREKEMMSCRGAKKVLPQELEEIIAEHPAVSKVCVLGMPNKVQLTLHCPRAFIVPTRSSYDEQTPLQLTQRLEQAKSDPDDEEELKFEYLGENKLCQLSADRRKALAEDIMQFVNEHVGWEKQLTGGIIMLDSLPTLRSAGKIDKSYLKLLQNIEIYGDRSG